MEEIEVWAARDRSGSLFLYTEKPRKFTTQWSLDTDVGLFAYMRLADKLFPEVQWSDDEPTKVSITIKKSSMEYRRKVKRTKNLTLRNIHVGDWVQVWSETTERYSPPLKITQIHDDGTVYLVGSGDLWKENIKNVDALLRTIKS